MLFSEIGLRLKNKREELGLSQADIAGKLKIPLNSIIAIESGQLDELPHEVYVRTFVRGYATCLNFNQEDIQNFSVIDELPTPNIPTSPYQLAKAPPQPEMPKTKGRRVFAQLLILALLGVGVYFVYSQNEQFGFIEKVQSYFKTSEIPEEQKPKQKVVGNSTSTQVETKQKIILATEQKALQTPSVTTEQKTVQTPPVHTEQNKTINVATNSTDTNKTQISQAVNQEKNATITENNTVQKTPDTKQNNNILTAQKTNAERNTNQAPRKEVTTETVDTKPVDRELAAFLAKTPAARPIDWTEATLDSDQEQVMLYVTEDCWIHVTVDGNARHFTLPAGNQREILFKKSFVLKVGNASALTLFHNRKLVSVGDSTKLRTVTLTAN